VSKALLTKTDRFPVNAARQNLFSQATATSTARKVNTARPIVNEIRPRNDFFKSHSPNRRPFNRPTASKANPVKVNGVNTAKGNAVKSVVKGNWENVVKPSARCEWRPINVLDNVSKDSASMILKRVDYIDAHELAIPGQTATGKESSNPFMAGSLPKTIHFCDSLQSDEDSFELIELMILCTNFLTMVRDLENLKTTYLIMKKVWVRMHPNRGGLMMQMQRLPSLMRLQMMLETRTTRFQTAIRSEEVFGYILLVIKKLTLKKLDD
ncbi:hypothetical protein Tco_1081066, partial [Tanacetum coccineum]